MSALKTIAVASLLSGLQAAAAFAAGPPKLDVAITCNGAARLAGRDKQACLEDEHAAQSVLARNWSKYKANDTTRCVGIVTTGGPPSYVELLSCLEAMRDAKEFREGDSLISSEEPTDRRDK
jgi:hypothetical protein